MHRSRASFYTFLGLLTGLAFGVLGYRAARPEEGTALRPVFIAKTTLPPGAHLPARQDRAKYFAMEFCPARQVPADAVQSLDELDGKVAGDRIREGTVLRREQLVTLNSDAARFGYPADKLNGGEVAYVIGPEAPFTGLQKIRPGDQVAVFALFVKDGKPQVTKLAEGDLLNHIPDGPLPKEGKPVPERHIVRMTYDQMLRTHHFESNGGIIFVVRKDPSLPRVVVVQTRNASNH